MGEAIGCDMAGRHSLQAIVANRGGRPQPFFNVARFQLHLSIRRAAVLRRVVPPHAGEAIRLQLDTNG